MELVEFCDSCLPEFLSELCFPFGNPRGPGFGMVFVGRKIQLEHFSEVRPMHTVRAWSSLNFLDPSKTPPGPTGVRRTPRNPVRPG